METYQFATAAQYDEFFSLMLEHMADYFETLMIQMGMSIDELRHLLQTVGGVYSINCEQGVAGFLWVEERGDEVHLHGIVLKENYQGQGIGTRALRELADKYRGEMAFIELGVHEGNASAMRLYERLGYQIVENKEDLDFYILRNYLK